MRAMVGLHDASNGDSRGVIFATSDGTVQVINRRAVMRDAERLTYLVQALPRLGSVGREVSSFIALRTHLISNQVRPTRARFASGSPKHSVFATCPALVRRAA
jgi:hypothetical protein